MSTPAPGSTTTRITTATTTTATNTTATAPTNEPLDAEIAAEREHLAASRAALRRMRERAQALYATGEDVAGDAYSAETLGATLIRRIAELADDPSTPLFFGRLSFAKLASETDQHVAKLASETDQHVAITDEEHAGHEYHIGRRHVTDDAGEPMVLDWRAPLSRTFYQASARDPQGVAVRRRFGFQAGTLTGFEDEHLSRGEELGTASRILTAEIERPRVGPMRDIVATIQPDQDELVRAELDETICVQGAPGTGKTAVGLHRAAYLLYQHRERLRRTGVLVVGPNRAFLHYISAVLPALGEIDVEQSTMEELLGTGRRTGGADDAGWLKQDVRLATVLARALRAYVRKPTDGIAVPDGSWRWRVSEEALRRIVDDVRREGPPHAVGRERVRARVVALLQRQAEARRGDSPGDAWLRRMGRAPQVREFLDHSWPEVTPDQLLFELLTDAGALARAADGVLDPDEQAALLWARPPRSVRSARWSAADAVLLDEAAGLIQRLPSYGHVVIDEAQDLSPMQCRALARRSEHGSLTLLGDLAQGTAPWATRDWRETLHHLGKPDARVVPLTTGFRVPDAVVRLANRLLPALEVDVLEAVSLRRDGWLQVRETADLDSEVVSEVRAALSHEGSIAVIVADVSAARLSAALSTADITVGRDAEDDDARVTVLPASLAKGLEFDHVIVVEPAEIVDAEPRGLHRLYVVLTRAVSRLAVLHARPLPAALSA